MEQVKIGDRIYGYSKNFKDNKEIRASYNNLTRQTYSFDFEEWYQNGYWKDEYIPHVLLDGEKVISSIFVSIIDFLILGEKKRFIQIGTVMTDKDYRNLGLNRFIMERILDEWQNKCDLIYLFANDSVRNFYPKFGFIEVNEYQYSKEIEENNKTLNIKKLDMTDNENRNFLLNKIKRSVPVSKISMRGNESLAMFHCTSFMSQNVYYIEKLDSIVVAEFDEGIIYLNDVFSSLDVSLNDIIEAMVDKNINKIVFGFTPIDTDSYDVNVSKEDDTTLFVLGDIADFFRNNQLMFPVLSRT
ncbi:UNVERIFIED_CONTAM: putative acyltransferase [Acetivibrio alkalicellulosi]